MNIQIRDCLGMYPPCYATGVLHIPTATGRTSFLFRDVAATRWVPNSARSRPCLRVHPFNSKDLVESHMPMDTWVPKTGKHGNNIQIKIFRAMDLLDFHLSSLSSIHLNFWVSQFQYQVDGGLFRNVIILKSPMGFKQLSCKHCSLLIERNAVRYPWHGLLNCVVTTYLQRDTPSSQ